MDSPNSDLRCRHSLRVAGMSASESDATMTTAARVGCGSHCMSPGSEDQHQQDHGGAHEAGELGLRPGLLRDRGP